jgi:hypothetical protein
MDDVTLEKIDTIRERSGASYREAKEALERNEGDVIATLIEMEGKKQVSWTDEISLRSSEVIEKVKALIKEGNVTKISVKSEGKVLVEIPMTLGTLGAVVLPHLAILGVLIAVFKRCTIEVIRRDGNTETVDTQADHSEEQEHTGHPNSPGL